MAKNDISRARALAKLVFEYLSAETEYNAAVYKKSVTPETARKYSDTQQNLRLAAAAILRLNGPGEGSDRHASASASIAEGMERE